MHKETKRLLVRVLVLELTTVLKGIFSKKHISLNSLTIEQLKNIYVDYYSDGKEIAFITPLIEKELNEFVKYENKNHYFETTKFIINKYLTSKEAQKKKRKDAVRDITVKN